MKTNYLSLFMILFCSFFILGQVSAQEKKDRIKPTINLMAPQEGASFKIGDRGGVHFAMELTDNVELATYRLEVYDNFGRFNPYHTSGERTEDYEFDKTYDISGQDKVGVHHHEVQVPVGSTPGKYHFIVTCTDAAGNESKEIREILLVK